jgi:uncharacterized protein YndB with AHSA1/START domain
MAKAADVLDMEPLGVWVKLLQTAEETGGQLLELEVSGPGRVRIQVRPAGRTQEFMECVSELCRDGKIGPRRPYLFVDEWDVPAPAEAVFNAIADARTYPQWWRPVYIDVDSDGPAEVGKESRQHFKGRLPYHLHTRSTITAMDAPRTLTAEVEGDLRGTGTWKLTPTGTGTHVRFDWQVHADRKLLRMLTPLLRPLFRWNHNWAIARAMEGLEPYARSTSPDTQVMQPPPTQMVPSGSREM